MNYSIIIPHKNTPQLLRKCLDSIPKRVDVQIIVVDDNSDSDKVDFNDFPGVGEPHTEVYFTKEGKGAGYARNVGLGKAVGKWIVFADADDFFHTEIFDEILNDCVDVPYEVVFFKEDSVRMSDGKNGHRGDGFTERVERAIKSGDFHSSLMYSIPTGKVIKRQIIEENDVRFNEVKCGNDVVFMAKLSLYSSLYKAVDLVGYCITVNDYSITNNRGMESCVIRLQQDLEGAAYYRQKFEFNDEDRFWYFVTWYNVYGHSKSAALGYASRICKIIGLRCFIKYWTGSAYKDIKGKFKTMRG